MRAGPLALREPRVVDASPFYLRVAYAAAVRGVPARAFCEVAYPHRLRWPVLGRMIEMSISKGVGWLGLEVVGWTVASRFGTSMSELGPPTHRSRHPQPDLYRRASNL